MQKIKLGISDCLLGSEVRFNGGHRHHRYITETLGQYFDFVAYCPEVAIGMGVPRPPIRLAGTLNEPRAVSIKPPALDVTEKLIAYGKQTANALPENLCGFIVKSKSPSCGMERVKVYDKNGVPCGAGTGLFTQQLKLALPYLPIEEEGRLGDPMLRENFIERVYVLHRWHELCHQGLTKQRLIDFHSQHKLSLLAHSTQAYRALGQLLADLSSVSIPRIAEQYLTQLLEAFRQPSTRGTNTNVLQHCSGYLKNQLDDYDRAELCDLIAQYHRGDIPLIVPITLLQHYFRKHPNDYMLSQTFLSPYPAELRLRNLV